MTRSPLRIVVVVSAVITLILIAFWLQDWAQWSAQIVALVTGASFAAFVRSSPIVAVAQLFLFVAYGLAPMLTASDAIARVYWLAILWSLCVSLGAVCAGGKRSNFAGFPVEFPRVTTAHIALAFSLQILAFVSSVLGFSGYSSQITGRGPDEGLLGLLVTASGTYSLVVVVSLIAAGSIRVGVALALAASLTGALSGYRGSGFGIAAVAVTALLVLKGPRLVEDSRRLLGIALLVLLAAVAIAVVGDNVRVQSATAALNRQVTSSNMLDVTTYATRLDESSRLDVGVAGSVLTSAQATAVETGNNLAVLIPRVVWPNKPVLDYGNQVAVSFYGAQQGTNSTSISLIGQIYWSLPLWLFPLVPIGFGFAFARLGARRREFSVVTGLLMVLACDAAVVGGTGLLGAAAYAKDFLVVLALWWLADRVGQLRQSSSGRRIAGAIRTFV